MLYCEARYNKSKRLIIPQDTVKDEELACYRVYEVKVVRKWSEGIDSINHYLKERNTIPQ